MEVFFSEEASIDIDEAFEYYNSISVGLGHEFLNILDDFIIQISNIPTASAIQYDKVRVKPIIVFPFTIHYILLDNKILILRILNTNRSQ